jgi:hypothetical protein
MDMKKTIFAIVQIDGLAARAQDPCARAEIAP